MRSVSTTYFWELSSPVGKLLLLADDQGLTGVYPESHRAPPVVQPHWRESKKQLQPVAQQLQEYFDGKRRGFDLILAPQGTPFQQSVWELLQSIPYGSTVTYGGMARQLGNPNASRAVGAANGRNPISIVIPCHRAVGSNGALTGYAGGLGMKQHLLEWEREGSAALKN